jgi:inward rectifier potassium channel
VTRRATKAKSPKKRLHLRRLPPIERILDPQDRRLDIYHKLLTIPWWGLFLVVAAAYASFNLVFAGLYSLQDGSIANAAPQSFADAYFFSVQTMATIGYGEMRPATVYANVLVSTEVLLGMTGLAMITGLVFSRFSRVTARVMFSNITVIVPYDGVPTLMFRAANQRRNQILDAQVTVMVLRDEVSAEGQPMRRFHELPVSRPRTPMFVLTWTIMHPINEQSPLYGATPDSLVRENAQIFVTIAGTDETFSQTVHTRHNYDVSQIHWNRRFTDILGRTDDGRVSVDYRLFHETTEVHSASPRVVKS